MDTNQDPIAQLLEVLDNALTAALREVRRARAAGPLPASADRKPAENKSKSQTTQCLDILFEAGGPLHAAALVEALGRRGVKANRDSLVSALSKRVAPSGPFIRTAGNTFGLAARDKPVSEVQ